MERLIIKDISPSDKLDIVGINLYTDSDMTNYALYILHNDVITPQEWVKDLKNDSRTNNILSNCCSIYNTHSTGSLTKLVV